MDKTGKVEVHITDNQSWNSCRKVVADREFTFGTAIDLQRKSAMHSDCALIHGHLLQPKHGVSAVWMLWSTCLSFALNRVLGNNSRLLRGTMETVGH